MPNSLLDVIEAKQELRRRLIHIPAQGKYASMGNPVSLPGEWGLEGHLVHAIGVGPKIVNNLETNELSVRLYVQRKMPEQRLRRKLRLMKSVDGIPTDVIESTPAIAFAANSSGLSASANPAVGLRPWQMPVSPLCGGVSVSHISGFTGTIAYVFGDSLEPGTSATIFLSNNHVLANHNLGRKGDHILHPGSSDGGTLPVGTLLKHTKLKFGRKAENKFDAALGALNPDILHSRKLYNGHMVSGVEKAAKDDLVWKHGRSTGLTEGKIVDISIDALISYSVRGKMRSALFIDQLRIDSISEKPFLELGDSGSLVVNNRGKAVGLLFALGSDSSYGYANPIGPVLKRFNLVMP